MLTWKRLNRCYKTSIKITGIKSTKVYILDTAEEDVFDIATTIPGQYPIKGIKGIEAAKSLAESKVNAHIDYMISNLIKFKSGIELKA